MDDKPCNAWSYCFDAERCGPDYRQCKLIFQVLLVRTGGRARIQAKGSGFLTFLDLILRPAGPVVELHGRGYPAPLQPDLGAGVQRALGHRPHLHPSPGRADRARRGPQVRALAWSIAE